MTLAHSTITGFIPTTDLDRAHLFFSETLGLTLLEKTEYALEYAVKGAKLRVVPVAANVSADHTVFGWEVTDIESVMAGLINSGVRFEIYQGMPQDERGVCTFPGGGRVAWFKDPDGNTLSLTQSAR